MSNYSIVHIIGQYWCKSYFINDFLRKLENCDSRLSFEYLAKFNGGKVSIETIDKSSTYFPIRNKYNRLANGNPNPVVYDDSVLDNFGCGKLIIDIYAFEDTLGWCHRHVFRDAEELKINSLIYARGEDGQWERPEEEKQAEIDAIRRQQDRG